MRRPLLLLVVLAAGCGHADHVPALVECQIAAVADARSEPDVAPCPAPVLAEGPLDLAALWELALGNNPALRESGADVEAARGRLIQAGKYPNPHVTASTDEAFSSISTYGNPQVNITQVLLTAGKFRLDQAVARRNLDAAGVALLGRKFEVLTRLRRAYYDYLALANTLQVQDEVVASLERSIELTRQLVEKARTRPRTDLLRLQALLAEAQISRARARINLAAAWRQVAAEVGLPDLHPPAAPAALPAAVPDWPAQGVDARVQSAHSDLKQAALEAEAARLAFERARAEAVPNVTVGAGYIRAFIDETAGAVFSVEAPLPLWDRKQGRIHEARANWARAEAARHSAATRLSRETAAAFARYQGARRQAERYTATVLPQLVEALQLVREGYRAGAAGVSFADVQLAQEALNDARLRLAGARRELWQAVADLQGLMQLDLGEDLGDGAGGCGGGPRRHQGRGGDEQEAGAAPRPAP
jgi:cobalt-zinc-cadmium efflux system outer membrane protein